MNKFYYKDYDMMYRFVTVCLEYFDNNLNKAKSFMEREYNRGIISGSERLAALFIFDDIKKGVSA